MRIIYLDGIKLSESIANNGAHALEHNTTYIVTNELTPRIVFMRKVKRFNKKRHQLVAV